MKNLMRFFTVIILSIVFFFISFKIGVIILTLEIFMLLILLLFLWYSNKKFDELKIKIEILMRIIEYLISLGYKPFRQTKEGIIPCTNPYDFSAMREGYIDVALIKDNSTFIFGLNEVKKPPTLKYPRTIKLQRDDEMNRFLAENSPKEVFDTLLKFSI